MSELRFSTGDAAKLLNEIEPRLAALVRRGKIQPSPSHFAGRRQWTFGQVLQAAEHLGILTPELRRRLDEEVAHAP